MDEYIKKSDIGLTDFEIILCKGSYKEALLMLFDKIEHLPAADVRPVIRGEWDKHEDYDEYGGGRYVEWSCSECCHIVKRGWTIRDKNIDKKPTDNYCPNCGADMRSEPPKEEN